MKLNRLKIKKTALLRWIYGTTSVSQITFPFSINYNNQEWVLIGLKVKRVNENKLSVNKMFIDSAIDEIKTGDQLGGTIVYIDKPNNDTFLYPEGSPYSASYRNFDFAYFGISTINSLLLVSNELCFSNSVNRFLDIKRENYLRDTNSFVNEIANIKIEPQYGTANRMIPLVANGIPCPPYWDMQTISEASNLLGQYLELNNTRNKELKINKVTFRKINNAFNKYYESILKPSNRKNNKHQ